MDDETGLYYYGARYYDPRTSVWISSDPLREMYPNVGSYVYCHDNPVNYIDPTGMADFEAQQPQLSYNQRTYVAGKNASAQSLSNDLGIPIDKAIKIFQDYNNWDWGGNEDGIENVEGHTITIPENVKINESLSVKWARFIGGIEHGTGDPANDDVGRLPDYYTFSISGGIGFLKNVPSANGSITIDRHFQIYVSWGGSVNTPSKKSISASLVAGQMSQSIEPSASELREFLSGESLTIEGGYWFGGGFTKPKNNNSSSAIIFGIMTPQISGGYSNSPENLIFNKK